MSHDIVDGVLAGLLGPHLAQWLSRYRYWLIFTLGVLGTQLYFFISGWINKGLQETIRIFFSDGFFMLAIVAPIVIGLGAVFIAFLGSLNAPKKPNEDNKNNP